MSATLWADVEAAATHLVRIAAINSLLAGVLFGIVLVVCSALGRRLPALQHALWALVLLRLFLPPGLSHPLALGALGSALFPAAGWLGDEGTAVSPDASVRLATDSGDGTRGRRSAPWAPAAVGLWAAGAAAVGVASRRRLGSAQELLARARPVSDAGAQRAVERFRRRLGIRRSVRLLSADDRALPFTIGLVRPLVFVPAALLRPQAKRGLDTALAHELSHVARGDALALRLLQIVQCLYFFHPLVWVVGHRLCEARERLCDSLVVSSGLLPARSYAEGLLDVMGLDLRAVGAPALPTGRRRIAMRLDGILSESNRGRPRPATTLGAAGLVGAFLLPLAGAGPKPVVPSRVGEVGLSVQALSTAQQSPDRPSPSGLLGNPLPAGRVSARFGPMVNPFTGKTDLHRGIDLAAPSGRPVLAPADGTVEVATERYESSPGAGHCVMLDHGAGLKTFYSHLDSFEVRQGERVLRGETIARVGNTGQSTASHLHFEIWRDGQAIDPASMVPDWRP